MNGSTGGASVGMASAGNIQGALHVPATDWNYRGKKKRKLKKRDPRGPVKNPYDKPNKGYDADKAKQERDWFAQSALGESSVPPSRRKQLVQEVDQNLKRLRRITKLIKEAAWDESKHPRDPKGRFGSGGGAKDEGTKADASPAQKSRVQKLLDGAKRAWGTAKPVLAFVGILLGQAALGLAIGAALSAIATRAAGTGARGSYQYQYRGGGFARGAKTHESDAEKKMRAQHGAKAAHILALYLRPGTPGEKVAAAAALKRMGIDVSKFAKAAHGLWSALDKWLTEEEAQKILDTLLKNLTAEQAEKIVARASDLRKMDHSEALLKAARNVLLTKAWAAQQ